MRQRSAEPVVAWLPDDALLHSAASENFEASGTTYQPSHLDLVNIPDWPNCAAVNLQLGDLRLPVPH